LRRRIGKKEKGRNGCALKYKLLRVRQIEVVMDVLSIVDTKMSSMVVDGKYNALWEVFLA
jgi:hypothetical protein